VEKRQRERARRQKQQDKERRRDQRVAEKRQQVKDGKDSDLAGMVPVPQPGQIIDLDPV